MPLMRLLRGPGYRRVLSADETGEIYAAKDCLTRTSGFQIRITHEPAIRSPISQSPRTRSAQPGSRRPKTTPTFLRSLFRGDSCLHFSKEDEPWRRFLPYFIRSITPKAVIRLNGCWRTVSRAPRLRRKTNMHDPGHFFPGAGSLVEQGPRDFGCCANSYLM